MAIFIFEFIQFFDIFGFPIQIYLKRKAKFKSTFSGFISLFVFAISIYIFIKQFMAWYNIEISSVISSKENYSNAQLLNDNKTIEYIFDHQNYMVYFSINAFLPDSSMLTYKELDKYLDINYYYSPNDSISYIVESEDCNIRETNEFLDLSYDKKSVPEDARDSLRMCVENPLTMGFVPDLEIPIVNQPILSLKIRTCQNTTENNNSCATMEEIKNIIKYVDIQATIPNTGYDFKNQSFPIRRTYKYEFYKLDLGLTKLITDDINPTFLYKDYGLLNDDYRIESINFNNGKQTIDFNTVNEKDPLLFQYDIWISFEKDIYFMRNQKLNEIIGSFGGITTILFSIGSYICMRINEYMYVKSLLNVAFRFNPIHKNKMKSVLSNE